MVLGRSDQRRRRVVMDEAIQSSAHEPQPMDSESVDQPTPKQRRVRQYSRGADRRNQCRISDLIPVKFSTQLVVWIVCGTAIGLLNLGEWLAAQYRDTLGDSIVNQFSLSGMQNARAWACSITCLVAGLICFQIFGLRQHRSNDYRGTYRAWRWVAGILFIASFGCIVNVPAVATAIYRESVGGSLQASSPLVVALEFVVVSVVFIRLLIEARTSRGSLTVFVVSWIFSTATIFSQLNWIGVQFASLNSLVIGNLLLASIATFLLGTLTYARFVLLNASGAIYVKERVRKRKKSRSKKATGKRVAKQRNKMSHRESDIDKGTQEGRERLQPIAKNSTVTSGSESALPPRATPPLMSKMQKSTVANGSASATSANKSMSPASSSTVSDVDDDVESDKDEHAHLSKSERKRLRRLQQQNRRAA